MKNDFAVWTQHLARAGHHLAISVDIMIIDHFVFSTPFSFSFGFHCVCVISQNFPFHCPHMFILIFPHKPLFPITSTFAIIPLIYKLSVYPPFCLFFSFWAAWVFDVRWAREQGIGYTPQTGNEKFKQIDPCLCASERKTEACREECTQIERGRRWRMWNRRTESRGCQCSRWKGCYVLYVCTRKERGGTPWIWYL